ncbi:hypothetical protein SAMN05216317_1128 [Nitrosomonas eutropha]|uniref:hypothetical protein n=1 Tax=Nitrosomonas TaxID=914 RepID=UPI000898A3D9|nr:MULTISPECIES: hypothetical protein [Nitrosomonas]MXS80368.1 hypothetical protein [Nitrosomonas sp. GH22]SDW76233.1 hypothetical protein SAMN05216317_1128 [Nitrosomonas eutropha]
MHDIDRTTLETNTDLENYEHDQYEYGEFGEAEWGGETGVFSETETMELAAELLEISDEAELDQFLGNLIKKAGQVAGKFIRSPVGQQLGGLLKSAAKKALPMVGSAIGGYFGGTSGARVGGQVASNAGRIFGLELEGLSHEDQEYEVAKRFVQLAGAAAKNAALAPRAANPVTTAQSAIAAAARQLAPGLIRGTPPTAVAGAAGSPCPSCGRGAMSGRWIRRGNRIILFGA